MARSKTKVKRLRHRWILKKRRREEARKKALQASRQQ